MITAAIDTSPFEVIYNVLDKVLPGPVWIYLAAALVAITAIAIWRAIIG